MKTVGVHIDTLEDFMSMNKEHKGSLYVEGAEDIKGNLAELTNMYRATDTTILYLQDNHDMNTKEISDNPDFVKTFPNHAEEGTKGAEFIKETTPLNPYIVSWNMDSYDSQSLQDAKEIVIQKDEFNAYTGNPYAESVLEELVADRYIVSGVAANVCVDFFVMEALQRGKEVYVVLDAIKELPNIPIEPVYRKWEMEGAKFIMSKNVEDYLVQ